VRRHPAELPRRIASPPPVPEARDQAATVQKEALGNWRRVRGASPRLLAPAAKERSATEAAQSEIFRGHIRPLRRSDCHSSLLLTCASHGPGPSPRLAWEKPSCEASPDVQLASSAIPGGEEARAGLALVEVQQPPPGLLSPSSAPSCYVEAQVTAAAPAASPRLSTTAAVADAVDHGRVLGAAPQEVEVQQPPPVPLSPLAPSCYVEATSQCDKKAAQELRTPNQQYRKVDQEQHQCMVVANASKGEDSLLDRTVKEDWRQSLRGQETPRPAKVPQETPRACSRVLAELQQPVAGGNCEGFVKPVKRPSTGASTGGVAVPPQWSQSVGLLARARSASPPAVPCRPSPKATCRELRPTVAAGPPRSPRLAPRGDDEKACGPSIIAQARAVASLSLGVAVVKEVEEVSAAHCELIKEEHGEPGPTLDQEANARPWQPSQRLLDLRALEGRLATTARFRMDAMRARNEAEAQQKDEFEAKVLLPNARWKGAEKLARSAKEASDRAALHERLSADLRRQVMNDLQGR